MEGQEALLVEGQEVLLVVKLEVLVEAHPEEGEVESAVAVAPSGSLLHLVKILTRSSIHTSKLVKLTTYAFYMKKFSNTKTKPLLQDRN